jgi:membrane-bound lytic murein transglycosylase D
MSPRSSSLPRIVGSLSVILSYSACAPYQPLPSARSLPVTPAAAVAPVPEVVAAEAPEAVVPGALDSTAVDRGAERSHGDSSLVVASDADVAVADTLPVPVLAIDAYADHARVGHFVGVFSGTARVRTQERLSRGTRYDALIRSRLRAGGIPEDFRFLALIESGFDPDAYSSAAAVGMWQFRPATARGVGLRVDWWMDERRDVVRSTDAAVSFLQQLHGQFGSLYLAAAAYNGGPGRVQRGLSRFAKELTRTKADDRFFMLASTDAFAKETKDYVPQLIAAALIGRDPRAFGLVIDTQPAFVFDTVLVAPATALAGVGAACGVEARDIVALNGQFLRGMTPPDRDGVVVRVPQGCASGFDDRLAALDDTVRSGVRTHEVVQGETLTGLAKQVGVTTTLLRQYNPKLTVLASGALRTGTTVLLPTPATLAAARTVREATAGASSSGSRYTVRRGDTLGAIAQRHGTTVSRLKSLNGMRSDKLVAGKTIRVR